jgi:hypothetical protein
MPKSPADTFDPGTDPGRPHPYESLYRAPTGASAQPSRPTPRHFEPALSPPEGADNGYGWLFREEPAGTDEVPAAQPSSADTPTRERPAAPITPVPAKRRRGLFVVMVVLVLGVIAAAGAGAIVLLNRSLVGQLPADPTQTKADEPYAGTIGAVAPTQASADCQAPAARDDAGNVVSYAPGALYDNDPNTAWRCDGPAVGQTITFRLPPNTRIAEVGLVNGYAKVDATSGAVRYGEYRRITQVNWNFDDGTSVQQSLADGSQTAQRLRIPTETSGTVRLTIQATTVPGSTSATRDAALISEVTFGSPN